MTAISSYLPYKVAVLLQDLYLFICLRHRRFHIVDVCVTVYTLSSVLQLGSYKTLRHVGGSVTNHRAGTWIK